LNGIGYLPVPELLFWEECNSIRFILDNRQEKRRRTMQALIAMMRGNRGRGIG